MKKRVLVVEDEPSILDNVLYSLETEGFNPTGSTTGEEALARFSEISFELVILDIGLPDISGFELYRLIRKQSEIPIIFLTARTQEVDRIVGLEMGADDYVIKPFSPRELCARVRAVLRRCPLGDANQREGNPISDSPTIPSRLPVQIDEERAQIRYFGQPVPLSSTEFRMLQAFCRHPGRVYSRSQLMDIVWDEPSAAMERTVDVHIKSLRAKLRNIRADVDLIITHRGMGYSIKDQW